MKVVVLVGDRREVEAAGFFRGWVEEVTLCGCPPGLVPAGVAHAADLGEALLGADLVVGPVTGIDDLGRLKNAYGLELVLQDSHLAGMRKGGILLVAVTNPGLATMAERAGVKIIPYRDRDDFAILNSIPTAEGAIQLAMVELPVTLHGTTAMVLGFGRTGMTLARALHGLGARTLVVARDSAQLARALEMDCRPIPWRDLPEVLREAVVIFNTVPAPVLNRTLLERADREVLIIDLASPPGGVDREAAQALGIKTIWALGLPGKVAPKSAGRALFSVALRVLEAQFPRSINGG